MRETGGKQLAATPTRRPNQFGPYRLVIGVNVVAADTDAEAQWLFTSLQLSALNMVRGRPGQLPPPVDSMDGRWNAAERAQLDQGMRVSAVGPLGTVRERLAAILEATGADELILTSHICDHTARLRSFELAAQAMRQVSQKIQSEAVLT